MSWIQLSDIDGIVVDTGAVGEEVCDGRFRGRWVRRSGRIGPSCLTATAMVTAAVLGISTGTGLSAPGGADPPRSGSFARVEQPPPLLPPRATPGSDPTQAAVAWLQAYRTLRYEEPVQAWVDRVRPVVTPALAATYEHSRARPVRAWTGSAGWLDAAMRSSRTAWRSLRPRHRAPATRSTCRCRQPCEPPAPHQIRAPASRPPAPRRSPRRWWWTPGPIGSGGSAPGCSAGSVVAAVVARLRAVAPPVGWGRLAGLGSGDRGIDHQRTADTPAHRYPQPHPARRSRCPPQPRRRGRRGRPSGRRAIRAQRRRELPPDSPIRRHPHLQVEPHVLTDNVARPGHRHVGQLSPETIPAKTAGRLIGQVAFHHPMAAMRIILIKGQVVQAEHHGQLGGLVPRRRDDAAHHLRCSELLQPAVAEPIPSSRTGSGPAGDTVGPDDRRLRGAGSGPVAERRTSCASARICGRLGSWWDSNRPGRASRQRNRARVRATARETGLPMRATAHRPPAYLSTRSGRRLASPPGPMCPGCCRPPPQAAAGKPEQGPPVCRWPTVEVRRTGPPDVAS